VGAVVGGHWLRKLRICHRVCVRGLWQSAGDRLRRRVLQGRLSNVRMLQPLIGRDFLIDRGIWLVAPPKLPHRIWRLDPSTAERLSFLPCPTGVIHVHQLILSYITSIREEPRLLSGMQSLLIM
jgi:hypothetical protein